MYDSIYFADTNILYRFSFEPYTSSFLEVKIDLGSLDGTIYEDVFYALDIYEEHNMYGSINVEPNGTLEDLLEKEIVLFYT